VGVFEQTLLEVTQINAETTTYYVSVVWWLLAAGCWLLTAGWR